MLSKRQIANMQADTAASLDDLQAPGPGEWVTDIRHSETFQYRPDRDRYITNYLRPASPWEIEQAKEGLTPPPEDTPLEVAAQLSSRELDFINATVERMLERGPRPLVLMAVCSHIIGCIIAGAPSDESRMTKEQLLELIGNGVEV